MERRTFVGRYLLYTTHFLRNIVRDFSFIKSTKNLNAKVTLALTTEFDTIKYSFTLWNIRHSWAAWAQFFIYSPLCTQYRFRNFKKKQVLLTCTWTKQFISSIWFVDKKKPAGNCFTAISYIIGTANILRKIISNWVLYFFFRLMNIESNYSSIFICVSQCFKTILFSITIAFISNDAENSAMFFYCNKIVFSPSIIGDFTIIAGSLTLHRNKINFLYWMFLWCSPPCLCPFLGPFL